MAVTRCAPVNRRRRPSEPGQSARLTAVLVDLAEAAGHLAQEVSHRIGSEAFQAVEDPAQEVGVGGLLSCREMRGWRRNAAGSPR